MSKSLRDIFSYKISEREINYSLLNPMKWNWKKISKFFKYFAIVVVILGAVITIRDEIDYQLYYASYYDEYSEEDYYEDEYSGECNVSGIEIRGDLVTYISQDNMVGDGTLYYEETSSEDIIALLAEAEYDDSIKAVLLEVDSYGGYPVAAEEVAIALQRFSKPVVAYVRTAATSAAYWAVSASDIIFASALSDVGAIGVTSSYLDYSKKNEKDGATYNSLSTGIYKDSGDPDKVLTAGEKDLIMRDLNIINDEFIEVVSENRKIDKNKVRSLADGSSLPGRLALQEGLIDKIGDYQDAQDHLEQLLGEEINVCW